MRIFRSQHGHFIPLFLTILVHILMIVGVLFWDWSAVKLLLIYWLEYLVIDFFRFLKHFIVIFRLKRRIYLLWDALLAAFGLFMFHAVIFLFTIGFFIPHHNPKSFVLPAYSLSIAFILFFMANLQHFYQDFIQNKRYQAYTTAKEADTIINTPYPHSILLFFFILFFGMLTAYFDEPKLILVVWVGLMLLIDIRAHIRVKRYRLSLFKRIRL